MAHAVGSSATSGTGSASTRWGRSPAIATIIELNIGHFLVGEAIFSGLESAIKRMRALMDTVPRRQPRQKGA